MRTFVFMIILSICVIPVIAQNDPEAKAILEKVSAKSNSYKTIRSNFKYTWSSMQDNQSHIENGTIELKGDQYHLTMETSDIIFDGKSIYTFVKETNEINITKPEPSKIENGDFFFSNPRDLFKVKNDFKSKLIKEVTIGNILYQEIDLYPINLKTKYLRIRMHIDKNSLQIIDTKIFMKDGTSHFIEFSNFRTNIAIEEKEFQFDQKKYPGAEVNDMRF